MSQFLFLLWESHLSPDFCYKYATFSWNKVKNMQITWYLIKKKKVKSSSLSWSMTDSLFFFFACFRKKEPLLRGLAERDAFHSLPITQLLYELFQHTDGKTKLASLLCLCSDRQHFSFPSTLHSHCFQPWKCLALHFGSFCIRMSPASPLSSRGWWSKDILLPLHPSPLSNLVLSVTVESLADWNKRPLIADQPAVKPGKDMS